MLQQALNRAGCVTREEFEAQERGFTAVKHQREVGAGYFDQVGQICTGSTDLSAIKGSTEEEQF